MRKTGSLVLAVLLGAVSVARADGMLDPSFGDGGLVTTNFPFSKEVDWASAVVVLPDGRAVAAGSTGGVDADTMAAARYLTSGALDTTFSGDGLAIVGDKCPTFGAGGGARAALLQPDGRLVLVGECPGGYSFFVVRLTVNGSLEWWVTTELPGGVWAITGLLQPDGRIVALGQSATLSFVLQAARYNPDGSLDASFGTGGTVTLDLGQNFFPGGAVLQADGKLVIAGSFGSGPTGGDFGLVRLLPNGALDPSFDGDGMVISDFGGSEEGRSVIVLEDGRIVLGGRRNFDLALVRYLPNGSVDVTFGTGGLATADSGTNETVGQLILLPNGKLLLAGTTLTPQGFAVDFLLARFHPDGALDTSFGSSGFLKTSFNGGDSCTAVALAGPDLLLAAGYTSSNSGDFALARYIASTPVELLTFEVE